MLKYIETFKEKIKKIEIKIKSVLRSNIIDEEYINKEKIIYEL